MPKPADDRRYEILTTTEADAAITAAESVGGPKAFCAQAGVRYVGTYYRAIARGPVLPLIASAIVATADRLNGSQSTAA